MEVQRQSQDQWMRNMEEKLSFLPWLSTGKVRLNIVVINNKDLSRRWLLLRNKLGAYREMYHTVGRVQYAAKTAND